LCEPFTTDRARDRPPIFFAKFSPGVHELFLGEILVLIPQNFKRPPARGSSIRRPFRRTTLQRLSDF
jgi:hypothetical protein